MNKIFITYTPQTNYNLHALKSIAETKMLSMFTDAAVFLNANENIDMSSSSINRMEELKDFTIYVNESDLLKEIELHIRVNVKTIILVGYNDIKFSFIKEELYPIINKNDDVVINILVKNQDANLKNISTHEIEIKDDMDWEAVEENIKEKYAEDLNNQGSFSLLSAFDFLNSLSRPGFEIQFTDSPTISLVTENEDYDFIDFTCETSEDDLNDNYKSISFIDKNNSLTIEKTSDDLICLLDDQGNKIFLTETSKQFILDNLNNF